MMIHVTGYYITGLNIEKTKSYMLPFGKSVWLKQTLEHSHNQISADFDNENHA